MIYLKKAVERLPALALTAVAFSIALPIRVNSIVSIAALVLFLLSLIYSKKIDRQFFKTPVFLFVSAQAIVLLLGLLHSTNLSQGMADIERFGYVLLFPFLIYQLRSSGVTTEKILIAFGVGCGALILYGLVRVITNSDYLAGKNFWELGHTYFTGPMDIHPLYLSIYVIFIIFYLLELLRVKRNSLSLVQVLLVSLTAIALVVTLFFVRSQMSLITFSILLVLYLVIVLKRRAWLVTFILFTIGLLVFLLDTQRVSTFFDTYGKNVSSALDDRFHVWKGATEAIKTSPIIGGGTGAEHDMLNKAYLKIGYLEGELNSYNAHNQYLEFLVQNGPVHLLVFLALLFYAFKQSLRFPNHLFLLFCMMFTLIMFFESSLQLHKGVVFFYFFLGCFLFLRFDDQHKAADSSKNS